MCEGIIVLSVLLLWAPILCLPQILGALARRPGKLKGKLAQMVNDAWIMIDGKPRSTRNSECVLGPVAENSESPRRLYLYRTDEGKYFQLNVGNRFLAYPVTIDEMPVSEVVRILENIEASQATYDKVFGGRGNALFHKYFTPPAGYFLDGILP